MAALAHARRTCRLLTETGTHVAHCPSPFARYGHTLEDFGRYRRAGVNIGIGTDVAPHNVIEEMRLASTLARVSARDIDTTSVGALFHAATMGGADALGRSDIGRLATGAKADLVLVDMANPWMRPARDPLRSLVFTAADRAVRHGLRAWHQGNGPGQGADDGSCRRTASGRRRTAADDARCPVADWAGRDAEQISPLSLPVLGSNEASA